MSEYRFTGTRLVRDGGQTTITRGDVIEPTEAELEAFGDLFERVDETDTLDAAAADGDESDPEPPFDPTELTVASVRSNLDEGDYSAAELDAIEAAERAGEERSTALDAIEDARASEE